MTANAAEKKARHQPFYTKAAAAPRDLHDLHKQPEAELSRLREQSEEKESQITELQRERQSPRARLRNFSWRGQKRTGTLVSCPKIWLNFNGRLRQDRRKLASSANEWKRSGPRLIDCRNSQARYPSYSAKTTNNSSSLKPCGASSSARMIGSLKYPRTSWTRVEALTLRASVWRNSDLPDTASSRVLIWKTAPKWPRATGIICGMTIGLQRDLEQAQHSQHSSLAELRPSGRIANRSRRIAEPPRKS